MYEIRHRVGISAPQPQVLAKLTTIDGLATWWTRDVSGNPGEGGEIVFVFGDAKRTVGVRVERVTDDQVIWRCVEGPDEWLDNTMTFDLGRTDDETVLRFAHAWREPIEFTSHCSTKWAYFLLGLKASLEGGKGTPFPGELQISSWG
jgi:uncharacterized protein YndB with AHSA1/START domain